MLPFFWGPLPCDLYECEQTDSFSEPGKFIYQDHCNGYIQRNGNIIQGKTNKNVERFLSFQLLDVIV
jgi:hypothetical protein